MSLFDSLKIGLAKTRKGFTEKIEQLVNISSKVDEEFLEELEAVLICADVGIRTTEKIMLNVRNGIKEKIITSPVDIKPFLQSEIASLLGKDLVRTKISGLPTVLLVVGVNGVGKTTTIGKLGQYYQRLGYKIMFAAADTFRAAAGEQLEIWAERVNADIIRHEEGSDPAAVAYDALQAAKSRKTDILIIDTAGRLHTKSNLMEELKKIYRIISREIAEAPHETLLVLDATTGQNAMNQAKQFTQVANVTGVVLTKLDGTAKGGVVVAIKSELGIPVKWIGIGEKVDDLRPFQPNEFVDALFNDK